MKETPEERRGRFFRIMKKRVDDCKDMLRTNPVISILVIVSAAKD